MLRRLLPLLATAACAAPGPPAASPSTPLAPWVLVLGTAQDGGLPQIACDRDCCRAARADPSRARLVTSLLLVDPRGGQRWLFDATPDLARQLERAPGGPVAGPAREGARPPLFDGIFLTHAHLGHYTGLLQLGPEAYAADRQPVHASERMARLLRTQAPWSLLVEGGALELRPLVPGVPVDLAEGLSVTPIAVPHRDELSDTLAFVIRGPRRTLLYLPDVDAWERWDRRLEDVLAEVDVALLDGSFFDAGELPGRDLAEIPHPLVTQTMARLADAPASERRKVVFTHLNHSNPAADPGSPQAARVRAAGMRVAAEGQAFSL